MPLSWNEIRQRAANFVEDWKGNAPQAREEADAQTFQTELLNVYGVSRKQVAIFEHRVPIGGGQPGLFGEAVSSPADKRGYIDMFWRGHIIIEMKTPGKDKKKAYHQAKTYAQGLPASDLPQGILISDFISFDYYDLEKGSGEPVTFALADFPKFVELFGYLAGYWKTDYRAADPVNIAAAERMGKLHDAMKETGYSGHDLEMYLVRLLFCLFADDTGIFDQRKLFFEYIDERTSEDGSDLAPLLAQVFDTMNTPKKDRLKTLDEQLQKFPYVNGGLFEERLKTAAFNSEMRGKLLECCALDWSRIKPEIFGAMFQSVKSKEARRALGEHYTSEQNILKVVRPLFMDGLRAEFEKIKALGPVLKRQRLLEFHDKLCRLKFLDPACGCGNFLVVSYREIRLLEIDVLAEYLGLEQVLDIDLMVRVNVDQFYGIEIEEFPARIAQTALWLMDHLMNNEASRRFGKYIIRIPLTASPTIVIGNALTLDWESVVPKAGLSYILGNPPFLGSRIMNTVQKAELKNIFGDLNGSGELDYVTCWYKKAAVYMSDAAGTAIEAAFVSTNSICQGLQVPILWPHLMVNGYQIKINFAHQTFKWSNEARGKAAVYCVIVGFSRIERKEKKLYHYAAVTGDPVETAVSRLNAYLVDADTIFIKSRTDPLCNVPGMNFGNMPADGGFLLFTAAEKEAFLKEEPGAAPYMKPLISAREFINGGERWCLWLAGVSPGVLRKELKKVYKRVQEVKKVREQSARPELAAVPHLFAQITQPAGKDFILIPSTSSETRRFIPMGFFTAENISHNSCHIIPDGTLYHFGVLTSSMHMAWTRYVCGRLEMRYRYSKDIVYNNFPWPQEVTDKKQKAIEEAARAVLDARALFPESSLADLYDNLAMPRALRQAHQKLDKAVEKAYGKPFTNDADRVAHLFYLYQKMTEGLLARKARRRNI